MQTNHKKSAEQFFRAVYCGQTELVDELVADSAAISYPIFQKMFDSPVIRGKEAVKRFADRFKSRFLEPELTIDRAIEESNSVVLIWSFSATHVAREEENKGQTGSGEREHWGGISLIQFDEAGKVILDLGEESDPGPLGRIGKLP